MKKIWILLVFSFLTQIGNSQIRLLEHPELLEKIKAELHYTYSTDFTKARGVLNELKKEIPNHPVILFLEALNIFWENFPLTPTHPKSETFLALLEETTEKGKQMLEKDPESLEGLFFDLFARALYSQYWADNEKPGKVFPYLNSLYRQTIRGMELKDQFNEFYFTTGLYNYYIEAYPEKHPAYKPIVLLFHAGNKKEGLLQLQYCAENAIYVKNEARSFLTHLYLSYESNPSKASVYASGLYREFPRNPVYVGKYAEILIFSKQYAMAEIVVNNLSKLPGDFAKMEFHLYKGMLAEKYRLDYELAFAEYTKTLKLSEKYGAAGSPYNALAWMGLGRYHRHKKNLSVANQYFRMAQNASTYDYVIKDK